MSPAINITESDIDGDFEYVFHDRFLKFTARSPNCLKRTPAHLPRVDTDTICQREVCCQSVCPLQGLILLFEPDNWLMQLMETNA